MKNINILILACALALPPVSNVELLKMIKKYYPDYDVVFVNKAEQPVGEEYLFTPLYVGDLRVYIRRQYPYIEPRWITILKEEALVERKLKRGA